MNRGSSFDKLLYKIERGRRGLNRGIPILPRLDSVIGGICIGEQYLIGAETGVGKSKLVRHIINQAIEYSITQKREIEVHGFFLEESEEDTLAEFVLKKLYQDGIDITKQEMFSRINPISDELISKIKEYKEYYDKEYDSRIIYIDDSISPTAYHNYLMKVALDNGTFEKQSLSIGKCSGYKPKNPDKYVMVVVDTINLTDNELKDTDKQTIDKLSKCSMFFRKKCGIIPIIIQQLGADLSSTERRNKGILEPILRDFEDSKRVVKDSTTVLALFEPTRHKLDDYSGYNVKLVEMTYTDAKFVTLHILKNRNGATGGKLGCLIKSSQGIFYALPRPDEFISGKVKYSELKNIINDISKRNN